MSKHSKNYRQNELKIRRIETTSGPVDRKSRAGPVRAYMHGIQVFGGSTGGLEPSEKAEKASRLQKLFKQSALLFCRWNQSAFGILRPDFP